MRQKVSDLSKSWKFSWSLQNNIIIGSGESFKIFTKKKYFASWKLLTRNAISLLPWNVVQNFIDKPCVIMSDLQVHQSSQANSLLDKSL